MSAPETRTISGILVAAAGVLLLVFAIVAYTLQGRHESTEVMSFIEETPGHPDLLKLREEERLNAVVAGASNELEAIIRLRHWAHVQWDTRLRTSPFEPRWNARAILRQIRAGSMPGGLCSEYCTVFLQAALSLGWEARIVSLEAADGAGHRIVEVWSRERKKWILMDPMLDLHFERDGSMLNALDLHRTMLTSDTGSIRIVSVGKSPTLAELLKVFRHVTLFMRNNQLSLPSPVLNDWCIGIVDTYTGGRPNFSGHLTNRPDLYYRSPEMMRGDAGGVAPMSFAADTASGVSVSGNHIATFAP